MHNIIPEFAYTIAICRVSFIVRDVKTNVFLWKQIMRECKKVKKISSI